MLQNKLEKFISLLIKKTTKRDISWKAIGHEVPINVRNANLIDRAFYCKNYKEDTAIYFIRLTYPEYSMTGGERYDQESLKLIVYSNNVRIKEIDETEVDSELLYNLYKVVDNNNEQAEEFFDKLE